MLRPSFAAAVLLAASALTLSGCKTLPPSKPESQWTQEEARGAAVYSQKCARCHYPTNTNSFSITSAFNARARATAASKSSSWNQSTTPCATGAAVRLTRFG